MFRQAGELLYYAFLCRGTSDSELSMQDIWHNGCENNSKLLFAMSNQAM